MAKKMKMPMRGMKGKMPMKGMPMDSPMEEKGEMKFKPYVKKGGKRK